MTQSGDSVRVVVMGVAGCGKSTVGEALARRLGARFVDGDSLHPASNVAKMAAGEPLVDDDRWPWLAAVRRTLRDDAPVVVACSALARRYRDMLRGADGVRFVYLSIDQDTATGRVGSREGHFMSPAMVASQFRALEPPTADEVDVASIAATAKVEELVDRAIEALATCRAPAPQMIVADGAVDRAISQRELHEHVERLAGRLVDRGVRRVLLVPPDHTRLHSRAGEITVVLRDRLLAAEVRVDVLPALGTHQPMGADETEALFDGALSSTDLLVHDWRDGLASLGEVSADEVAIVSRGDFAEPIPVAIDRQVFDGYDVVVSVGQVVPHEVIGMANFTKNLVIGLGGASTIHRSHFLGAVAGMEGIMGRVHTPVRDVVDAAFDRFVAPLLDVLWVLTVVQDTAAGTVTRGLFVGEGDTASGGGAAFRAASELARRVNVDVIDAPLQRVSCWLDPVEFHSTWLGNKAVYRTRMAVADGGVLYVLGPGVRRFGEDDTIDALIRRHGYRGMTRTMAAVASDPQLATNLSAAAHLVHGSSEDRFHIVWCTDPDAGGLTRAEVESVGYGWMPLHTALEMLGVDADTVTGERTASDGTPLFHVANPALGLWATAERFGA